MNEGLFTVPSSNARMAPEFKALMTTYNVNVPNMIEAIWQPQFDTLAYAALGQTELRFFQQVYGQAGVTEAMTNMQVAGVMAAPQQFLVTGIRLTFLPSVAVGLNNPIAEAELVTYVNDVNTVLNSGFVTFRIGNKEQNRDAPIGKFPPSWSLNVASQLATITDPTGISYAQGMGQLYNITPANIPYSQNFDVTARWPVAVPLPSGLPGTLRCSLEGFLYRSAQ